jgi:hypothetical protein
VSITVGASLVFVFLMVLQERQILVVLNHDGIVPYLMWRLLCPIAMVACAALLPLKWRIGADEVQGASSRHRCWGLLVVRSISFGTVAIPRNVSEVFIADPSLGHTHMLSLVLDCEDLGITFRVVTNLFEVLTAGTLIRIPGKGIPLFRCGASPASIGLRQRPHFCGCSTAIPASLQSSLPAGFPRLLPPARAADSVVAAGPASRQKVFRSSAKLSMNQA